MRDNMNTREYIPRSISVRPTPRVLLVRILYALTTGIFGRGFGFAIRMVGKVVPSKSISVNLSHDSKFVFRLDDFYWNRIVLEDYRYEPEIEIALHAVKDLDFLFLDCGANIGYWSVLASSEEFGNKVCVAIEASADTFENLTANSNANSNRFSVLCNAIYSENGHRFIMSNARHHAARHIQPSQKTKEEFVESITIDTIISHQNVSKNTKVVIKLDVEGQEINALKGSEETLKRDFLLVYEDHEKEKDHDTTRYILAELGLEVYFINDVGVVRQIKELSELDAIKETKGVGYNFFACKKSSSFSDRLQSING